MTFDKWFNSQSTLVKVLLLLIPFVGWIVEILVRLSVFLRTKNIVHLIMFLVFAICGFVWIPVIIDLVCLCVTGKLFLTD